MVPPVESRHLSPHAAAVPACRVRGRAVGLPVAGPLSPAARPTRPTSARVSRSSALPGKRGDGSSTEQRIGTSFPLRNKRGGSPPPWELPSGEAGCRPLGDRGVLLGSRKLGQKEAPRTLESYCCIRVYHISLSYSRFRFFTEFL